LVLGWYIYLIKYRFLCRFYFIPTFNGVTMRQDYNFGMIQLCHKIYIKRIMHYETSKDPANHENPKHLKASNFYSSV